VDEVPAHGLVQLVVGRDRFPRNVASWADTITVAPSERFSVLITAEHPGVWASRCHILAHAERAAGMSGMVIAFIVTES
jgi:manganese oxidase